MVNTIVFPDDYPRQLHAREQPPAYEESRDIPRLGKRAMFYAIGSDRISGIQMQELKPDRWRKPTRTKPCLSWTRTEEARWDLEKEMETAVQARRAAEEEKRAAEIEKKAIAQERDRMCAERRVMEAEKRIL